MSANRSKPRASTTASRSRTNASTENVGLSQSERPLPLVVMDEGMVLCELFGPVPPDRAFPTEGQMAEPVRRPHQRGAVADAGIRDPDTIRSPAKLHLLSAL